MAILNFSGFDSYDSIWNSNFFHQRDNYIDCTDEDTPYGIGQALKFQDVYGINVRSMYPASSEFIVGFALKIFTYYNHLCFGNFDYTIQSSVRFNIDGTIELYRYTTSALIAEYTIDYDPTVWNYVEVKCGLGNGDGYFIVRINEEVVIDASDIDNVYSGTDYLLRYLGFTYTRGCYIDNMYVLNNEGTENNDFLGEVRIDTIYPSANGTINDGVPSIGENYECVDDPIIIDDTDFITLSTVDDVELFTFENLPDSPSYIKEIYGVKAVNRCMVELGNRNINLICNINSNQYESSIMPLPMSFSDMVHIWELNPDTSLAWTEADVNSIETGIKLG